MATLSGVEITDGTLTIRRLRPEDRDAVVAACRDAEIARWIPLPQPYTAASFDEWLGQSARMTESGEAVEGLVMVLDGRIAGAIGIKELRREPGYGEIGYWVTAQERGRGLAARAVRLLREWGEHELGLTKFELLIHPDNAASRGVARQTGFEATGEYRTCPRGCSDEPDHMVFAYSSR